LKNYVDALYPTKREWQEGSRLKNIHVDGENLGDIPAPFVVVKSGNVAKNTVFRVGACSITTLEACTDLTWDSKTGLVTGKVGGSSTERPIKYSGKSYGAIPTTGATLSLNGAVIKYSYWYY
jgi:hypothetical protein